MHQNTPSIIKLHRNHEVTICLEFVFKLAKDEQFDVHILYIFENYPKVVTQNFRNYLLRYISYLLAILQLITNNDFHKQYVFFK